MIVDEFVLFFYVCKDVFLLFLIIGDCDKEFLGCYEEMVYFWWMMFEVGYEKIELFEFEGYDYGGMVDFVYLLLLRFIWK